MSQVTISAWKCDRQQCGHVWVGKGKPKRCAKCKSPYWDVVKDSPSVFKHKEYGVRYNATLGKMENLPDGGPLSKPQKSNIGRGLESLSEKQGK